MNAAGPAKRNPLIPHANPNPERVNISTRGRWTVRTTYRHDSIEADHRRERNKNYKRKKIRTISGVLVYTDGADLS